ncbi:MAG: DUF308 domain-containing protein [Patulibacter sp.]
MAKQQQRQIRLEQRGAMQQMQALEERSDEDLLRETRNRSVARAILGSRAAERYDGATARKYFQEAIAAARPQERPQIRRMAEASLALADRRSGDLRAAAARMGQEAPSRRQLFLLWLSGLLAPPRGSSGWIRARGVLLIILIVIAMLAIGTGIVALIALPFGGLATDATILLGLLVLIAALVGLVLYGRKRQRKAQAKRAEMTEQQRQPTNRAARRRG